MTLFLETDLNITFLDHTKSELGEGPTYDPASGTAWWFDIEGKKLFEHAFKTGTTRTHDLPFKASMTGIIDVDRQVIASENGLYLRNMHTGNLELLQPLEAEKTWTRSNDGRVHPCGAIWIGTMGHKAETGAGAIYHYFKGELTELYREITIPNAICFSADGRSAYFTDTMVNRIMKVAIDPANAQPIAEAEVFFDPAERKGGLDGAVVDCENNLWIAVWGASCILKLSPSGNISVKIPLPVRQPTCPCFIGPDLDRLLVTSAWQGNTEAAKKGDAGKTLIVDVPVKGKAEPRVVL